MVRPEDSAGLFLRLRPIGLALRATPAAPFKGGFAIFSLMLRPPLLFKEGNLLYLRRRRWNGHFVELNAYRTPTVNVFWRSLKSLVFFRKNGMSE